MKGKYYVRSKSSLSGKRVKKDPAFRITMVNAGLLGQASKIGSFIYKSLPENFRQFWMYRAFTGEAMGMLKEGKSGEEAREILFGTYVRVKTEEILNDELNTKGIKNEERKIKNEPRGCFSRPSDTIHSFYLILKDGLHHKTGACNFYITWSHSPPGQLKLSQATAYTTS